MTIRKITLIGMMAAVICVMCPWSIPVAVSPVPITLALLAIMFASYLLGWKYGTLAVLIYLLLGGVGLPVFSGFTGGFQKLAGPTGGYLVGYLFLAAIGGLAVEKTDRWWLQLLGLLSGVLVCYLFGTVWFCIAYDQTFLAALSVCVVPYLPADGVKIAAALLIGPQLKKVGRKFLKETKNGGIGDDSKSRG